jgi:hypothetical protein
MVHRHVVASLVLVGAVIGSAHAADVLHAPTAPVVDPARAKAKELEKQRLIAKLHADAPKVVELRSGANPLDAPIFHRYDRP